jgi:hypothetical protein
MRPFLCLLLAAHSCAAATLKSPDGRLQIDLTVSAAAGGQLVYKVSYQGRPLLGPSPRIVSARTSEDDRTYSMPHGKSDPSRDRYNALHVNLVEPAAPTRKNLELWHLVL